MQLQSFIYCKIVKSTTKSNPNDDALQSQVLSGGIQKVCVRCRAEFLLLIAQNIIQIIFLGAVSIRRFNQLWV